MTKPKDKFDWLYRRQIANLPMTPSYVRNDFTKWWNALCKEIDSDLKKKDKEIKELKNTLMNYGDRINSLKYNFVLKDKEIKELKEREQELLKMKGGVTKKQLKLILKKKVDELKKELCLDYSSKECCNLCHNCVVIDKSLKIK